MSKRPWFKGPGGTRGSGWFPSNRGYRGGSGMGGPRGGNRGGRGRGGNWSRNDGQPWRQHQPRDVPTKRLSEEEIFVTEYVTPGDGFHGIIKNRYSDFQVSEINEIGEVAQLTDLSCPKIPEVEMMMEEDDDGLLSKYNLELLPLETWDKINMLAVSTEDTEEVVNVDVTGKPKEFRGQIHESVKKAFGEAVVGKTVTEDDKKFVSFQKYRKGIRVDKRVKWPWKGEFVHFVLYKENCDTMEAANKIAERLRMKSANFGYAGTKDRRAKTSQWFSVKRTLPKKIVDACAGMRELKIGNFQFKNTHLKLGMLSGNKFQIVLRNVVEEDSVVEAACEALIQKGFINYYGLQRFGTRYEVPTFQVGLHILRGQYQEAIDAILEEREGPLQRAVQTYKQRHNAQQACKELSRFDKNATTEGKLLVSLAKEPNDFVGALGKVARNTRLLYIHSYQSLVWNRCVSERLRRHGFRPAVGDLVPGDQDLSDKCLDIQEDDESDSEENGDSNDGNKSDENGGNDTKEEGEETEEPVENPNEEETTQDAEKSTVNISKRKLRKGITDKPKERLQVKVLTEEDIISEKYSIYDIVMPLPGNDVEYPPNMKEFYEETLTKDGLSLNMTHKVKCYRLTGAYRRVVSRPRSGTYRTARYQRPDRDLILSDWDLLQGLPEPDLTEGKYKALILTLTLPSSSYATMALRELLKRDTSSDSQARHNDYFLKDEMKRKAEETSETDDKNGATEAKKVKEEVDVKTEEVE